jgi:hypothetical protein
MRDMTQPARNIDPGDKIAHDLMPGFPMKVLAVRPCETSTGREQLHEQFEVTDPEGRPDWVCAYDVHRVL